MNQVIQLHQLEGNDDEGQSLSISPQSPEAEAALIGAVILDPSIVVEVAPLLRPAHFSVRAHETIWKGVAAIADRGDVLDIVTLADELNRHGALELVGGVKALNRLSSSVPDLANATRYAGIIRESALKRACITAGRKLGELGQNRSMPAAQAVSEAEALLLRLSQANSGDYVSISEPMVELWNHAVAVYEAGGASAVTGVPTSFGELDSLTGGLQREELTILAARPGVGKTSFALGLALEAALKGSPVGFFSLEMSRASLVRRLASSRSRVPLQHIDMGTCSDDEWNRFAAATSSIAEAPIFVSDDSMSLNALKSQARRMVAKHQIKLVVVDYLQLLTLDEKSYNRTEAVTKISAGLKALAKELKVPLLALSQLSRESERRSDHKPQLSDLRDSGSIEQDADVVMFLHRPGLYEDGRDKSITDLLIAKNRNGPIADISLSFNSQFTKFTETDQEDEIPMESLPW